MGILGAAKIAPSALIHPARDIADVVVHAASARSQDRAIAFSEKHGITTVHRTYADLVDDREIDAIYNPLPNALHAEWTIRALKAGKHVLCEKPIASNETEARAMAEVARETGNVLMEAFHYRYHPLAGRMKAILTGNTLGKIQSYEATFLIPFLPRSDIRFDFHLGGGATMDAGCYAINMIRFLSSEEPDVVHARAKLSGPEVDRYMTADFRFPSGATGRINCSLRAFVPLRISIRVTGELGTMHVINPLAPHLYNSIVVRTEHNRTRERVRGPSTYSHQLNAFARAVLDDEPFDPGVDDSIRNMRAIDSVYQAAGLKPRGT
jgi:predicted dehydrogenase